MGREPYFSGRKRETAKCGQCRNDFRAI